jgi:hypothetical protein
VTYAAVDTAAKAVDIAGGVRGVIGVALLKKAAVRLPAIVSTDDQREYAVCRSVIEGTMPSSWVTMVFEVLDINGTLAAPTDTQVDTAVNTAWAYYIKSRS